MTAVERYTGYSCLNGGCTYALQWLLLSQHRSFWNLWTATGISCQQKNSTGHSYVNAFIYSGHSTQQAPDTALGHEEIAESWTFNIVRNVSCVSRNTTFIKYLVLFICRISTVAWRANTQEQFLIHHHCRPKSHCHYKFSHPLLLLVAFWANKWNEFNSNSGQLVPFLYVTLWEITQVRSHLVPQTFPKLY